MSDEVEFYIESSGGLDERVLMRGMKYVRLAAWIQYKAKVLPGFRFMLRLSI